MARTRTDLPGGTVTFLFTDVEGSTKLLHELGSERYAEALAEHRHIVREAFAAERGVEVDTQGDAFFVAFPTAPGALAAVEKIVGALEPGPIRLRMGLHTGTPYLAEEGYVGPDVNRAARIAAAGHGGQVLVSAATASLLPGARLHDLGEHRLKDLSAPERIFQLGHDEFPPLTSLYRTNLPIPATPFVGRESELAEVRSLLMRADTRLLTLTGPGGTGKTRLALQAAAEASEAFPDGVYWVPLSPIRDPKLVAATAAQAVGSSDGLAEHIADKRMLCLFDNFEQVVEAAAELGELLAVCPNLSLLVTSRERLRLRAEQTYAVPQLAESDAESLFVARARAVDQGFALTEAVRELCRRLDELPLAIELAAARTTLFSPEQLLERLSGRLDLLKGERDADPRQHTLRATIEWSHELLSEDERRLFSRLAVFSGGCTYESAVAVADGDPDTLQSLLDKSLLRKRDSKTGPRYWMLETIREYAAERLEGSGEAHAQRLRHAEHFLGLADEGTFVAMDATWVDRVDADLDNVRDALEFAAATGQSQRVLNATARLRDFWFTRGFVVEARRHLERALAADAEPTPARCSALIAATNAASVVGDVAAAEEHLAEALALADALGDARLRTLARLQEAWLLTGEHEWRDALAILDEVVPALRDLGAWDVAIPANRTRAYAYEQLGDMDRFWELTEENLAHSRAHGHLRIEARSLGALAQKAADEGRFDDQRDLLVQSATIDRRLGNVPLLSLDLVRFAVVHIRDGNAELATRLIACAVATFDEIGFLLEAYMTHEVEEATAAVRARLDGATFDRAWQEGARMGLDAALALALGPDA